MEKDIGKISKNDQTDIVVRVDDFGGRPGITIREFVTSDRYTGFTKSGVKIQAADFPKFKEMINSVSESELQEMQQATEQQKSEQSSGSDNSGSEQKPESGQEQLPDY